MCKCACKTQRHHGALLSADSTHKYGVNMRIEEIKAWNKYVTDRFVYSLDPYDPQYSDTWKDWSQIILDNPTIRIYDDCDGLACTVASLLYKKGATNIYRLMVGSEGPTVDHMVAMVEDDKGQLWIVGDTWNLTPVRVEDCPHKILHYNNFTKEGISWRDYK